VRFQEEYCDRDLVQALAAALTREAAGLAAPLRLMEVCGTHTMAVARFGLKSLLPAQIRLVSGPGCPVCVTPVTYLDHALALAGLPGNLVASFGDLLRVPGSVSSLMEQRARGADVRVVYSALDAVALAAQHPDRRVIFLGVGFETTAPPVAAAILTAAQQKLQNFFVLGAHKTMPQAMALLSADPQLQINGYICPAHVSTVIGGRAYQPLVDQYHIPCVVTGFEAADLVQGILLAVRQQLANQPRVEIQYRRAVSWQGNQRAQQLLKQVFEPCDAEWRGLGVIAGSGLRLRERFGRFDAACQLPVALPASYEPQGCRCGEVLSGRLEPTDCPLFGTTCQPETPVGACMVSSEGSCAAAWRYGIA
jgi:hydrogenase expression/formation protein HypD